MIPLVVDLVVDSDAKKSVTVSERSDLNSARGFLLGKPFERLQQGLLLSSSEYLVIKNTDQLKEDTLRCTDALLEELHRLQEDEENPDIMLTILWSKSSSSDVYTCTLYSCKMPQIKQPICQVLVHGPGRSHAACKHSKWIEERKTIEEYTTGFAQRYGIVISETILSTLDCRGERILLEGLITNLFVVKEGKVYTAPAIQGGYDSPVLAGSTRQLVLKACTRLGIEVVQQTPRLGEASQWQAAFVTSVVRIAVQVSNIHWETSDGQHQCVHLDHPDGREIVQAIRCNILYHQYFV